MKLVRSLDFKCRDCRVDTADIDEYYMVQPNIWQSVAQHEPKIMLCIGCLESRLGRTLTSEDFTDALANSIFPQSKRLVNRIQGISHEHHHSLDLPTRHARDSPNGEVAG